MTLLGALETNPTPAEAVQDHRIASLAQSGTGKTATRAHAYTMCGKC